MKTNSDYRPLPLLNLGDGSYHFNYNIQEVDITDESNTRKVFDYDTVHVRDGRYGTIVAAMIREKYTIDEELAIQRQRDEKAEEFRVYFEYCEECKTIAKQGLGL